MDQPLPTPSSTPATGNVVVWRQIDAQFGRRSVLNFITHEFDQSIELYFSQDTRPDWLPTEAQLRDLCALGFSTVYCNFADDTEFIGGWRIKIEHGRKVPGGEYWVMSRKRDQVGAPRWSKGATAASVVLEGAEADLFREFLEWKRTRGG